MTIQRGLEESLVLCNTTLVEIYAIITIYISKFRVKAALCVSFTHCTNRKGKGDICLLSFSMKEGKGLKYTAKHWSSLKKMLYMLWFPFKLMNGYKLWTDSLKFLKQQIQQESQEA